MPFISSLNLIRTISVLHLALAYYFLTNPSIILNQALVWILGESMGLVSSHASFLALQSYS